MPSTRDNGITVPINADAYNLTGDLATMADSARVASLALNQAAMDALTKFNGRLCVRVDQGYSLYVTDGSTWFPIPFNTPYGHMGRTGGNLSLTTTNTTVTVSAAQDLRGGMTFEDATDSLVIPRSGLYNIRQKLYVTGAVTAMKHTMSVSKVGAGGAAISGTGIQTYKVDSSDWYTEAGVTVNLAAGDKIYMQAAVASGTSALWGTDGYNGTWIEAEYIRA